MADLLSNIPFWSAIIGLVSAQGIKPLLYYAARREWDCNRLWMTGGMPSSHTSTIIALTASIAMTEGFGSAHFAICFVISLVVMNDAMNVRLETGKQAEIINEWSEYLTQIFRNGPFSEQNLKTMIGHSSAQVLAGLVWGLLVGLSVTAVMM